MLTARGTVADRIAGLVVMGAAWKQIHWAKGELVIFGLFRKVRHPQYFGLFLITLGMLIQWPTIVTATMWPVLMFMYYRLARREESEMEGQFGGRYAAYPRAGALVLPRLARAA